MSITRSIDANQNKTDKIMGREPCQGNHRSYGIVNEEICPLVNKKISAICIRIVWIAKRCSAANPDQEEMKAQINSLKAGRCMISTTSVESRTITHGQRLFNPCSMLSLIMFRVPM